jgi:hypothetical protein
MYTNRKGRETKETADCLKLWHHRYVIYMLGSQGKRSKMPRCYVTRIHIHVHVLSCISMVIISSYLANWFFLSGFSTKFGQNFSSLSCVSHAPAILSSFMSSPQYSGVSRKFVRRGQQIPLRTEDREYGDQGAVAP